MAEQRVAWQRRTYSGPRYVVRRAEGTEVPDATEATWVLIDQSTGNVKRRYSDPLLADEAARRLNAR